MSHKPLIVFTDWMSKLSIHPFTLSHTRHARRYDRAVPVPAVGRRKVIADFDGGRLTSDGGIMLQAAAERRLGIADRLAGLIANLRNPLFVAHSIANILRARMLAIACGYEDADDPDHPRPDPGFKLAYGRLPDSGHDLCSQLTVSRWENAPRPREVVRLPTPW